MQVQLIMRHNSSGVHCIIIYCTSEEGNYLLMSIIYVYLFNKNVQPTWQNAPMLLDPSEKCTISSNAGKMIKRFNLLLQNNAYHNFSP